MKKTEKFLPLLKRKENIHSFNTKIKNNFLIKKKKPLFITFTIYEKPKQFCSNQKPYSP